MEKVKVTYQITKANYDALRSQADEIGMSVNSLVNLIFNMYFAEGRGFPVPVLSLQGSIEKK